MQLPGQVTYFILLSLGCSGIAFAVHMIALSTPFWRLISIHGVETIRSGLWKDCLKITEENDFVCSDIQDENMGLLFKTVQGSVLIALIFILVGGVATAAALAMARENLGHGKMLRFGVIVNFFAGDPEVMALAAHIGGLLIMSPHATEVRRYIRMLAMIVAIVVYGILTKIYIKEFGEIDEITMFGWSFILEITVGGLELMAVIMAAVHIRFKDDQQHPIDYQMDINTMTMNTQTTSSMNAQTTSAMNAQTTSS